MCFLLQIPHIKWLKKVEAEADVSKSSSSAYHTLSMGSERYRVLDSGGPDVLTSDGQYLNRLVIPRAGRGDAGMYICFVTNSGFGALTYKSARLRVSPRSRGGGGGGGVGRGPVSDPDGPAGLDADTVLLSVVACVVAAAFVSGLGIVACIIRRGGSNGGGRDQV